MLLLNKMHAILGGAECEVTISVSENSSSISDPPNVQPMIDARKSRGRWVGPGANWILTRGPHALRPPQLRDDRLGQPSTAPSLSGTNPPPLLSLWRRRRGGPRAPKSFDSSVQGKRNRCQPSNATHHLPLPMSRPPPPGASQRTTPPHPHQPTPTASSH